MFSLGIVPVYAPIYSALVFPFLHVLISICYILYV